MLYAELFVACRDAARLVGFEVAGRVECEPLVPMSLPPSRLWFPGRLQPIYVLAVSQHRCGGLDMEFRFATEDELREALRRAKDCFEYDGDLRSFKPPWSRPGSWLFEAGLVAGRKRWRGYVGGSRHGG